MFERFLIEYCSSTLASLKTASLFSYTGPDREQVPEYIESWNEHLNPRGVYLVLLHSNSTRMLIYVYRASALQSDLNGSLSAHLLAKYGYAETTVAYSIEHLKTRIDQTPSFPHEIGLFLGYPPEDVAQFIKHQGQNCKYCGIWKVYYNEPEAKRTFAKIHKCREIYKKLFCGGRSVLQLTVAA